MKAMELRVWVEGVQRVVCGVTEFTTCQEVVLALAQATGQTGRYTLIERWRDTERPLSPQENPVVSLNKWGQYAGDVQLILHRSGASANERPASERLTRGPERGLYHQSLPPSAKLRSSAERSLRRKEPKRKSLTFSGGARGLRHIFSRSKDSQVKQTVARGLSLSLSRVLGGEHAVTSVTSDLSSPASELSRLVQLQKNQLQTLEARLEDCEGQIQDWDQDQSNQVGEDRKLLEQQLQKIEAELEEHEFWTIQLHLEQETEQTLRLKLQELQAQLRDSEDQLQEHLSHIQTLEMSLEQEQQQNQEELNRRTDREEVLMQLEKVRLELKVLTEQSTGLDNSSRAVERSLSQSSARLQEKEQELEQLTRELRQVNLQQFIQKTGSKVTVLPMERNPETERELDSGSLTLLQSPTSSSFNPEGIYV